MPDMEIIKKLKFLKLLLFIFCYILFPTTNNLLAATTSLENSTFSLTNFNPNGHEIVYEGDASPSGGVLQLTLNQRDKLLNGSTGRAIYKEPIHLWESSHKNLADFTTHFYFSIDSLESEVYGDGFAFFLCPNGSKLPNYSGGGNFGLLTTNSSETEYSKALFVAVEFDTFSNDGWDPYGNHIGIDLNSVKSLNTTSWGWSDIKGGGKVQAKINYNSSSHDLTVLISEERDSGGISKNFSSLSYKIDLREHLPEWVTVGFSGSTGSAFEIHSIYSWDFSSILQVEVNNTNQRASTTIDIPPNPVLPDKGMNMTWLGIIVGVVILVFLVLGFTWFWIWMKRNGERRSEEGLEMEVGARKLPYKDLVSATDKFNEKNVLGEGGFGKVYKGFLKNKNCFVAVKRITPNNTQQGSKEFTSEVTTISKLGHVNLVELIGWCSENQEYLIVYKFMPNKSLDFHLFEQNNLLSWENRYKIAMGLASALHYLQEEQNPIILHRDIKSSNILLDAEFNAKLGDFGLAKLVDHGQQSKTTTLRGTEGYLAPEYQESSIASKESDIYSFGVVCLEIACGKPAIGVFTENGEVSVIKLVEWVWGCYERDNVVEAADPKLRREFKEEEMRQLLVVGLACAQPDFSLRPSIKQVIDMLDFKSSPTIPREYPGRLNSAASIRAHMELIRAASYPATGQAPPQFSDISHSSKASTSASSS